MIEPIHVQALYRYPVKSMGGETLNRVKVTSNGLIGDRCWAVRDEKRGGIRGAKRFPTLMKCKSRYLDEPSSVQSCPAEIILPDGSTLMTNEHGVANKLTDFLGHEVTFWPLVSKENLDHYKRGAPVADNPIDELRRVFARNPDEPLPDISAFPEELKTMESLPGTYFDALPILIMSVQSLQSLQDMRPESRFDVRRFRPNLLIDMSSDAPFPELELLGKTITIGDVELNVELECPRCIMTTHEFEDLPKDPQVIRTIVMERKGNLGVYATVKTEGHMSQGDAVIVQ